MTKKVFRIHKGGADSSDWFSSTEINSNLIEGIHTDGGDGKKLPTSIPSPFARIDLVRTAFKTVADQGNLEGLERNGKATATDNHKLISDALDIGQILFNYDKHKENLKLVAWDKKTSLKKLLDGNDSQKHLGKTINLFLEQDARILDDGSTPYNFDKFDKIYILKYNHKIIGGTSPRTLFFAAPDASEIDVVFGQDKMLDDKLLPLYRRDKDYIKYLYSVSKSPNFNRDFPEFKQYILKTLEKLDEIKSSLFSELNNMDCPTYLNTLKNVFLDDNAGMPLEIILGISQKQFVKSPALIESQSDFVINASKSDIKPKPLVLPVEQLDLRYTYTEDNWNSKTVVPAEDKRALDKRTLPDQGDLYPYLTMNDFLTDSIIKLPYKVNSDKFLTVGSEEFLLPIKKEFFKYFSVEDIIDNNLIKTTSLAVDCVQVELNIPIKVGFIVYKKIYYPKKRISQERDPKQGTIIEKSFALSVYPFVASADNNVTYSVGVADIEPRKSERIEVGFYKKSDYKKIETFSTERASEPLITQQSIVKEQFDAIELKVGDVENIIIPKWRKYKDNSGEDYHFTIDFGTTNSHIEYKIGQGSEKAYDITEGEEQIAFLMPNDVDKEELSIDDIAEAEEYITQEVISERFGKDELRNAPFRTCLVVNREVNYKKSPKVFADANIAFDYEKLALRKYLQGFTDLKWSQDTDANIRTTLFIEEMLMLCKNKVLINNGNLSKTKITWFYPVSMSTGQYNRFVKIWEKSFTEVFNIGNDNLSNYPESIAPFYFYKKKGNTKTHAKPSVSIDIGGGTTDVLIFSNNKEELITSFKFAGNAIFGDGFNGNISSNGFVQKYYSKVKDILTQNDLRAEVAILDKIYESGSSSADLITFFFSLKNNKDIKDKELDIDFSDMLEGDSDFKVLFLLFYSSIVYHIAEMMKIKEMEMPLNILFSGTGSKTLNILDSTKNHSSMRELFAKIFNKVYGVDDSRIEVNTDLNPKELTCKGGFYMGKLDIDHTKIAEVSVGNFKDERVQNRIYATNESVTYKKVNKDFRGGVIANIENFYTVFTELNRTINFNNIFDVSKKSLKILNEIIFNDIEDSIMSGIEIVKADSDDEDLLSETLFFYPWVDKLNELAFKIYENE